VSQMNVPNWRQKLTAELKRDKKKSATLAVLCVVAGIVAGRIVMKPLPPAKANAAAESSTVATTSGGSASPAAPFAEAGQAQRANPNKWREYIAELDTKVSRDIFLADESVFPPQELKKPESSNVVVETGPSPEEKLEAKRRIIKVQAQALVLQSTIVSATPTAIINDRVLRKGDWISGFKIVAITPRTCTLKKDGIKVTLGMKGQTKTKNPPPREADDGD